MKQTRVGSSDRLAMPSRSCALITSPTVIPREASRFGSSQMRML
jgi:hypothetical protein